VGEIYVFGCGGHAKVVSELIEAEGRRMVAGYVDREAEASRFLGRPVLAEAEFLASRMGSAVVFAVGENGLRRQLLQACGDRFTYPSLVHPFAEVSRSSRLGEGTVVMPGAVVNAGSAIGSHCVIGSGAVVEHDCRLGDFVTVGPRACVCGGCRLEEGCYLGAGATVIQGQSLGGWSVAGAGSLVCDAVAPNTLVIGVPARFGRAVAPGERLLS
jgi:acetyltransferase EpsM